MSVNKRLYKNGWYLVKPIFDGRKYEVIYHTGVHLYREDIRVKSWDDACEYCRNRIDF